MRRRAVVVVCVALAVQFSLGQLGNPAVPARADQRGGDSRPNIVLIVIDTLRADHVSAYGYERETTRSLDTLVADQGVRFQDATSTSPWTFPAVAAMMTGISPSGLGATWETTRTAFPGSATPLAQHLRDAGYYTAGFVTNSFVGSQLGFDTGYAVYDDSLKTRPRSEPLAGPLTDLTIDWLETTWTRELSGTQPLFLLAYHFDPHTWYNPPPPYDTLYDSTYTGTLTADVYQDGQDVIAGKIVPTARDVEHLLALYDGEIAYTDAEIGRLLNYLEEIHVLDNALVVVTSDHGEHFGEHGLWMHGNSIYEEAVRVPLLIRYTGVISPGLVMETPVQSSDLMPTLLDWAGIPIPPNLDALSLRPLMEGDEPAAVRDIHSEVDGETDPASPTFFATSRYDLRSVRRENWKLIHRVGGIAPDELYALHADSPYETSNLAEEEPERARALRQALLAWFRLYRALLPSLFRP